ncbi:MAG: Carboxypeptidase regulatory-like domain [Thermoanaerobaculia bacterium]|jgi:hypothetical protein|nr:Carboxypeptidase regulatory-like domain [Thermoanaerobaculia bacterium]
MKRNALMALLVALLVPAAGWPAPGDGVGGVEVGVRKKPGGGQIVRTTKTDARGAFSLDNLEPGSYTVIITIPGAPPSPPQANVSRGYFESRSNVARAMREGSNQVFRFTGWPYSVSVNGADVSGGNGTIVPSPVLSATRGGSQPKDPAARIEFDVELKGTAKSSIKGVVGRTSAGPLPPVAMTTTANSN